jgi:DNA-binding MarR family transcriptional regulator
MRLLCELHDDGPQRMADLASALDVTPRNVTTLVDGLERDELVRRRPHPTDRRATVIELTDSADSAVGRSMEHQAAIGHLFETLAPADRATLIRLIGDLEGQMRPNADPAAPEARVSA